MLSPTQFLVLVIITLVGGDHYHPERSTRNPDAFNSAERSAQYWRDEAMEAIKERLQRPANKNIARNVIMFLADGLSIPTLAAARTLKGQRNNKTGEETQMFFETFPTVGLSKTYCLDQQVADSACTATACLCGVKNIYNAVGVSGEVAYRDCPASLNPETHLDSIAAWALAEGKDAGIVTTTRVTHASPAAAYARTPSRHWESDVDIIESGYDPTICRDIAHQLLYTSPGNQLKVILGAGRREFYPNTSVDEEGYRGRRWDGRYLIQEWLDIKRSQNVDHEYVWNREQLMNLASSPPEYVLGLFEGDHMQYYMEANVTTEPTLTELTEFAIRSLNRTEKGFFLFVEGGRIDHAHHNNVVPLALDETIQMDLAIQRTIELLGTENTLVVVTSDHGHVMSFNGYVRRGADILGPSDYLGDDDIPYMTLSYTNGPGARTHVNNTRVDVTQDSDFHDTINWRTHAEVHLGGDTHGAEDVAVFAIGPFNHLFTGLYEQSQIPHLMGYAACIGPGLHACSSAGPGYARCIGPDLHACSSAGLHNPLALPIFVLAIIVLLRTF